MTSTGDAAVLIAAGQFFVETSGCGDGAPGNGEVVRAFAILNGTFGSA